MKRITLTLLACFLTLSAQAKDVDQLDVAKCAAISWFTSEYIKDKTDFESVTDFKTLRGAYYRALRMSTNERLTRTAGDGLVRDLNATEAHSAARDTLVEDSVQACIRLGIK